MKLIDLSKEKLIQAVLYFSRNTKYFGKIKCMKLLFFLDFMHYRQTGCSVTGRQYYAWEMGPVPVDVWRSFQGDTQEINLLDSFAVQEIHGFHQIIPKTRLRLDLDIFTERELKLLKDLSEIYKEATAENMIEISHLKNSPWDTTLKEKGMKQLIDYNLALDGSSDQLDPEIMRERQQEQNEMKRLFR